MFFNLIKILENQYKVGCNEITSSMGGLDFLLCGESVGGLNAGELLHDEFELQAGSKIGGNSRLLFPENEKINLIK